MGSTIQQIIFGPGLTVRTGILNPPFLSRTGLNSGLVIVVLLLGVKSQVRVTIKVMDGMML